MAGRHIVLGERKLWDHGVFVRQEETLFAQPKNDRAYSSVSSKKKVRCGKRYDIDPFHRVRTENNICLVVFV
jgi:hypothetical protein